MIQIIPSIDILHGRSVRLRQGDFSRATYYELPPLEFAKNYEANGFQRLHLVDLDGAQAGSVINLDILKQICANTKLTVDFGGGVRSESDLKAAFDAGAAQVNLGSLAIIDPQTFHAWLEQYGSERIILAADFSAGIVLSHGWQHSANLSLTGFLAAELARGIRYVACTDVNADGELKGVSASRYAELVRQFPQLKFIASGGISSVRDIQELDSCGTYGAIIGRALIEGQIRLADLEIFLKPTVC